MKHQQRPKEFLFLGGGVPRGPASNFSSKKKVHSVKKTVKI